MCNLYLLLKGSEKKNIFFFEKNDIFVEYPYLFSCFKSVKRIRNEELL